jgi:hypothetical protein
MYRTEAIFAAATNQCKPDVAPLSLFKHLERDVEPSTASHQQDDSEAGRRVATSTTHRPKG